MRLLHTSDWHLGQALHNFERSYEHQCFLDWLLDTIVAEQADALLISGDVFDTANPSAGAQKQLYRFLQQARARSPQLDIVIIAGNHDSPGRLEAPGPLLEAHGTVVVGHVVRNADGEIDLERMLVPLRDQQGEVRAWCVAMPVPASGRLAAQRVAEGEAPADPYSHGIAMLYQQAYALAQARRAPGQAILAMGHCHMVDGQASLESERRIVIGGTEALPATMFDPAIAYVALGHLHLAQRVGQKEHIRYCGSPLPLSFAEVGYQHQVLRIDLVDGAAREVTPLMVPRAGAAAARAAAAGAAGGSAGRAGGAGTGRPAARTSSPSSKCGCCSTRPSRACAAASKRRWPASRCGWPRSNRPAASRRWRRRRWR